MLGKHQKQMTHSENQLTYELPNTIQDITLNHCYMLDKKDNCIAI